MRRGAPCNAVLPRLLPTLAARRPCACAFGAQPQKLRGGDAASCAAVACRLALLASGRSRSLPQALPTTRAPGEAAWHRRARRARAEARVLVRLDAARARLSAHHSAPFGGMQRRGGGSNVGNGKGGGGGALAARQFLLSLFDGAVNGRGPGPAAGKAGGKNGNRRTSGTWPREGEWQCQCGFETNRASRDSCYSCGRFREAAQVSVKGGARRWNGGGLGGKGKPMGTIGGGSQWYGGPIGAGGSRPMLGGRGQNPPAGPGTKGGGRDIPHMPTGDGKGPTYAAMASKANGSKGAKGDWNVQGPAATDLGKGQADATAAKGGPAGATWGRPKKVFDSCGYELVQPRRVRIGGGANDGGVQTTQGQTGDGSGERPATMQAKCRWSDADSDDDGECEEDPCDEDEGDGAGGEDDWTTDPRQLRATFEEHARAVKGLERAGGFGPALETMRLARDEAERKWREAKTPAPLPKRLLWAEAKLQKAQSALTRARLQLEQFDEEAERRRAEYLNRVGEAESWCKWRREQLESIHNEAAGGYAARDTGSEAAGGATEMRRRLRSQVLPELHAILESMQEGTDVHGRMALVLADLADAETRLCPSGDGDEAERFYMYDGDTADDDWGDDEPRGADTYGESGHRDEETEGRQCRGRTTEWRAEGPGRWTRANGGGAAQAANGADYTQGTRERAGANGNSGDTKDDGTGTQGAEGNDEATGERSGKHRRRQTAAERSEEERKATDARRAQELQEQLQSATAAQQQSYQEGAGGFGSQVALSWAAQKFVLDVQRAQAQAGEMGVEPTAEDGRSLLQLSPMELQQWREKYLDESSMHD